MNTKTTSVSLLCGYILVSFPGHCTVSHAQTILRESGVLSDISCYVEYSQLQSQIRRKHSYSRWQKSCNRQVEQWKTTIDLLHMNLIIFPSLASWFIHSTLIVWFSTISYAVSSLIPCRKMAGEEPEYEASLSRDFA